ncbi:MAG: pyridoxal-phosphate dependent enzyme [Proteobacteria bacterium]|nr:pyridoxal-phosphate dependent enzyme [Pseudomonadota bacterium]MBI3496194.1 pyridoxal-phosphate dependent enzyme [Pseudomonadota bacterium]
MTGIAFGGNKTRNLEFRLARTMMERPDVVIVGLDLQSNSARQTVGACNRLGLETILVLVGERPNLVQGNLLVDYLLGAEVVFAASSAEQRRIMDETASRLRADGRRPHILNDNPMFDVASAVAYIECTMEIMEQLDALGLDLGCLYMSSSGKGQAGLVLAQKLFPGRFQVRGITATREHDVAPRTAEIANRTAVELRLDLRVDAGEIQNFGEFVGERYGVPTEAGNEAVRLFARTEGVILDPVYTGKCAAAMVQHIRQGAFGADDILVFVHTGGAPAIFTHSQLWL